jgi:RimJ/RimL family protein N-acetyltransferase
MAIEVRPMRDEDRLATARIYADVAAERNAIGAEPPVDIEARAASWTIEGGFVALLDGRIVGSLSVQPVYYHGYGEIGMHVASDARGQGVGSALMEAAIAWARAQGLHKLSLSVWPHNTRAIALYEKFGFVEEGRRVKQYRRKSGELWDTIDMGLLL